MTTATARDSATARSPRGSVDLPSALSESFAVRLGGVTKRYGEIVALDDVSLDIRSREFLAILGPSGSGKTTTMRVIAGFERPDAGSVQIAGVDVSDLPPYSRDVNTVFQSYALFPHMTVEDNVAYGLRMKGVRKQERRRRAGEMLELVQLEHARLRRPMQLSGGMQQRVALARALVNDPDVLLLDEPLGALDRKLREDMKIELRRIQTTVGITFVYVTHDQEEALSMSDRVVVMRDGRIEQVGAPGEVYDSPSSLWVADFVGTSSRLSGVVRSVGQSVHLDTDVAPVVANRPGVRLAPGDRAVAVVRPEEVRIAGSEPDAAAINHVRVTVEEILNMGAQAKVVARTPGGTQLVSRLARTELSGETVAPGKQVWMWFRPEAVHVFAPDATATQADDGERQDKAA